MMKLLPACEFFVDMLGLKIAFSTFIGKVSMTSEVIPSFVLSVSVLINVSDVHEQN
jgi:hypothetical protein